MKIFYSIFLFLLASCASNLSNQAQPRDLNNYAIIESFDADFPGSSALTINYLRAKIISVDGRVELEPRISQGKHKVVVKVIFLKNGFTDNPNSGEVDFDMNFEAGKTYKLKAAFGGFQNMELRAWIEGNNSTLLTEKKLVEYSYIEPVYQDILVPEILTPIFY